MNTATAETIVTPAGMVFKQLIEGQEEQWEVFYDCATEPEESLGLIRHNWVSGETTFFPEGDLVEALGFNHFALSAIAKFIKSGRTQIRVMYPDGSLCGDGQIMGTVREFLSVREAVDYIRDDAGIPGKYNVVTGDGQVLKTIEKPEELQEITVDYAE